MFPLEQVFKLPFIRSALQGCADPVVRTAFEKDMADPAVFGSYFQAWLAKLKLQLRDDREQVVASSTSNVFFRA